MSKILTVFGATGNQGGSVIKSVLADPELSKEFKIRAVTRDASKESAKALAAKPGVEVVEADMSSEKAAAPAVSGAHTVFLVTNFWESMSAATEIAQGKAVVDASKAAGVKHIIFSSLVNTKEATNGRLSHISHFDGKAEIEQYVRDSGIPGTFVQLGLFMSGLFGQFKKGDDGVYTLNMPVPGTAKVPLFDVANTGPFVKIALKNFPSFQGKHIHATTDYATFDTVVSQFGEVVGAPAKFNQIPAETFKSFLPPPVAEELLENMLLLNDVGYYGGADVSESLRLVDQKPTTWKEYVAAHKEK